MADPIFEEARLAEIYDALDDDRSDLDVYVDLVGELGARSVLDIGCGTGTLACLLARRGIDVVGVDPAAASLAVARGKPFADRVRWMEGEAAGVPPVQVDLAVMTANVAQVFLTDDEWHSALRAAAGAVRRGGHVVFEVRDPARRAWEGWTRPATFRRVDIPGVGVVETWIEVTRTEPPLISFRHTFVFEADGSVLTSDSTLRFRDRDEITQDLHRVGLRVREVRDAPDRPGLELVFLTQRPPEPYAGGMLGR